MSMDRPSGIARKQGIAGELEESVTEANNLAEKLGLDPYPVKYWIVDHDEMNELIAYGGFQTRYPHWRWGMQYDRQQKQDQYGGGKAFEIVNNDNPAHAFLQESNSIADQKAVITHVEAHSDFFANNEWFGMFTDTQSDSDDINAATILARHADKIEDYMTDPEIDREEVEKWIDHCLCLEDNIDQHAVYERRLNEDDPYDVDGNLRENIDELDLSDEVRNEIFDEQWLEQMDEDDPVRFPESPEKDILGFILEHGMQYDEDIERAVEMEPWQKDILEMMREESYYFATQKMTKVMNEGWAAYWESMMMSRESFAENDEFITYADHMARVLGSGGLNPYALGLELWQYVENKKNRDGVVEQLLRVDGVSSDTYDDIDTDYVQDLLTPDPVIEQVQDPDVLDAITEFGIDATQTAVDAAGDKIDQASVEHILQALGVTVDYEDDPRFDADMIEQARDGNIDLDRYPWKALTYEGLAERHYSLNRLENRGFLDRTSDDRIAEIDQLLMDTDRYNTIEEAIEDVDYTAGWDEMFDVRGSHNDVTFLDTYLTPEFITENNYFTYEHSKARNQFLVASDKAEDVKNKLLLQFTNFGKPTIAVYDGNFENQNELLLGHNYNGVMLDQSQAAGVLERTYELWGRPVSLVTTIKEVDDEDIETARHRNREPEGTEAFYELRYDGDEHTVQKLSDDENDDIDDWFGPYADDLVADDIDYDTTPDEWLQ